MLSLVHADGGAVYIRWGRKGCPGGADLVYSGITKLIGKDILLFLRLSTHTHA